MPVASTRVNVVVAGGGVAGVELTLALHDLARDRVRLTMITPQANFGLQALRTADLFCSDHVRCHPLSDLTERTGAELITDTVTAVDLVRHTVCLAGGRSVHYDALVLAVGAHHHAAFRRALTFLDEQFKSYFNGLLADLEEHWTRSVAFVVPPGTTWPLPLYELALMTARDVRGMGIDDLRLQIVSPEPAPLAIFGQPAIHAVAAMLADAGIAFRGSSSVHADTDGVLRVSPDGERLDAERIVALPTISGPELAGVPTDEQGFIAIDEHGGVRGVPDVYAAGDATTFPVKQGGLACQLADAIAAQLAATAGADIQPEPFRPILRGRVLSVHGAHYLEHSLLAATGTDHAPELQSWSAARKVHGRYLSPWLAELDGIPDSEPKPEDDHVDAEQRSTPRRNGQDPMGLDPYSPLLRA
jgi:sulfide:quinone oxidoreductase